MAAVRPQGTLWATLALLLAGCAGAGTDGPAGLAGLDDEDFDDAAYITGQVVDTEIVPIEGVDVSAAGTGVVASTDATGSFRLGPLAPGAHTLQADKHGYASAQLDVTLAPGLAPVQLILEPVAADVPYHETNIYQAYVMCHVVVAIQGVTQILNAPCAAIIDLFAPNTAPDDWVFPFTIEKPGFKSLALEMTWHTQQFGHDGLMQLTMAGDPEASGGGVTIGGTVYGDTMASPFHAILHAGQSYWQVDETPVYFYPEENVTQPFELLVAGGGGNTTLQGSAVFVEFRPTVYVSFFYNRPASDGFSALPDE